MRKGIHKNERTYCSRNNALSCLMMHGLEASTWEMEVEGLRSLRPTQKNSNSKNVFIL